MKYITFLFILIAQISFGQSKALTKIADGIAYQGDTIQAVYDWVTNNIKYDAAKLKKLEKGANFYRDGNYKSIKEYKAASLEKVIKRKKGVCDDYTLLMYSLASELGYTAHVVEGITKGKSGNVNRSVSHSWIAIKVNGNWKLYDPTWGAGYLNEKKKFVKKYNLQWYDVEAEKMRETHFPFDPIWQLSNDPMNYQEFVDGKQKDVGDEAYDYAGMIEVFLGKDLKGQKMDILARSESNGGNIKAIKKYRNVLKKKIEFYESSNSSDIINSTLDSNREASEIFSDYVEAKKKRFKSNPWTMEYSKNALMGIQGQLEQSIVTFESVEVKDSKSKRSIKSFISQSKKLLKLVDKEIKFLDSKL